MSINLLGGFAHQFKLEIKKVAHLRPTLAQLKRKIFDRFQDLSDYRVYDLCSGTGSIGLEAASRSCSEIIFFENSKKNFLNLKNNLFRFKKMYGNDFHFNFEYHCSSFTKVIEALVSDELTNVFYFDPPFDVKGMYEKFYKISKSLEGILFIEGARNKTPSVDEISMNLKNTEWKLVKEYKSGDHFIAYFEKFSA